MVAFEFFARPGDEFFYDSSVVSTAHPFPILDPNGNAIVVDHIRVARNANRNPIRTNDTFDFERYDPVTGVVVNIGMASNPAALERLLVGPIVAATLPARIRGTWERFSWMGNVTWTANGFTGDGPQQMDDCRREFFVTLYRYYNAPLPRRY